MYVQNLATISLWVFGPAAVRKWYKYEPGWVGPVKLLNRCMNVFLGSCEYKANFGSVFQSSHFFLQDYNMRARIAMAYSF
jgi:hypothetical protein